MYGRPRFYGDDGLTAEQAKTMASDAMAAVSKTAEYIQSAGGVNNADLGRALRPILDAAKKRAVAIDEVLKEIGYSGGAEGGLGQPARNSGARMILEEAFPKAMGTSRIERILRDGKKEKPHDKYQRRLYIEERLARYDEDESYRLLWDAYDAVWKAEQNGVDVDGLMASSTILGAGAGPLALIPVVGPVLAAVVGVIAALMAMLAGIAEESGQDAAAMAQGIVSDLHSGAIKVDADALRDPLVKRQVAVAEQEAQRAAQRRQFSRDPRVTQRVHAQAQAQQAGAGGGALLLGGLAVVGIVVFMMMRKGK